MAHKITLRSSDGKVFMVDETVAMELHIIKHAIEDSCTDSGIPLPNVNSKFLSKVLKYYKKHVEASAAASSSAASSSKASDVISKKVDEELKSWDAEFIKVNYATLTDLVLVTEYLDIKGLLDLTRQTVTDIVEGRTFPRRVFDCFA